MRVRVLVSAAGLAAAGLLLIAHPMPLEALGHTTAQDAPASTTAPASGIASPSPNDTAWD
jgi:hypothetical protein